jgi:hypothetical protein
MGLYIGKWGGGEYGSWTLLEKDMIKTTRRRQKRIKKEKEEKKC